MRFTGSDGKTRMDLTMALATPEAAAETRKGMTPGTVIQSGCHVNPMSGSPAIDAAGLSLERYGRAA